jgi:hypothetical protein
MAYNSPSGGETLLNKNRCRSLFYVLFQRSLERKQYGSYWIDIRTTNRQKNKQDYYLMNCEVRQISFQTDRRCRQYFLTSQKSLRSRAKLYIPQGGTTQNASDVQMKSLALIYSHLTSLQFTQLPSSNLTVDFPCPLNTGKHHPGLSSPKFLHPQADEELAHNTTLEPGAYGSKQNDKSYVLKNDHNSRRLNQQPQRSLSPKRCVRFRLCKRVPSKTQAGNFPTALQGLCCGVGRPGITFSIRCGVHQTSCLGSTGAKQPENETHYSPPSIAVIKNAWVLTSTHPYAFMACCLIM